MSRDVVLKKKWGTPETRLRQRFLNNLGLHTCCTEIILHCVSVSNQLQQWTNFCTNFNPKKWGTRPPCRPCPITPLPVSICVCLSVTSRSFIETVERIELVLACELPSTYLTQCYKKICLSPKITVGPLLTSGTWLQTLFRHSISIVERAINLARERWTVRA